MTNNGRLIDANVAFRFLTEQLVEERGAFSQGINKGLNIARSALRNPDAIPTFYDMPSGDPLTLDQLREMNGYPGFWDDGETGCFGIITVDSSGKWKGVPFFRGRWKQVNFEYNIEARGMKIHACHPTHIDRSRWVSVQERLPMIDGKYICFYGFERDTGRSGMMFTGCLDYYATDKEPHWQHASTGLFVTHWMPLPEPPVFYG